MQHECDLCGNPTEASAYVCELCTKETADYVRTVVDLAGEVETNVARLARYATRGGHQAAPVEDEAPATSIVNRRQLVETFGWPASKDRPKRGALRAGILPVDLNASARAMHAFNHVTTWARTVEDDRGLVVAVRPGQHPAAAAAAFLLDQLDWIRHQPFADEANEQLRAAGAVIRRVVDSPPEREVVGRCDCGTHLYAYKGLSTVTCPDCDLRWDVASSRETLRETLRGYLMTPSEAALLLTFFGVGPSRDRTRKTIVMWAQRGRIAQHGVNADGDPVYLFGDLLDRALRVVGEAQTA